MNFIFALSIGDILLPLLVFGAMGALVWYLLKKKKESRPEWESTPTSRAMDRIKTEPDVITPNGVKIYYLDDVKQDLNLAEIDRGVDFAYKKAACNYLNAINDRQRHEDLGGTKIVVIESERAPESGAWSFKVPIMNGTDPYYNSEWDMMKGQKGAYHYLLAAEQMVAVGEPFGDVFVLPYIPNDYEDKNYLARACSYSMEHILLSWYDGNRFEATKYHTDGTGHPIIPACEGDIEL